jgi:gas vesicle protein
MFNYRRSSSVGSFVKGAILGGLAIGATALFCSPVKGKELRKGVKKQLKKTGKVAYKNAKKIKKSASRFIDDLEDRL